MIHSLFARYGKTNSTGKLTGALGTLRLSSESFPLVQAAAQKARLPLIEFIRRYVDLGFIGRQEIERRETVLLDALEPVVIKANRKESE